MPQLSISQVARQAGLRASAIRYYEQIGILEPAQRISGQRRYDTAVLQRLAVIMVARESGFTLTEIRELFFGFREGTPPSRRWQRLSRRKIAELDALMRQIEEMKRVLQKVQRCRCDALHECGQRILRSRSKACC